MCAKLFRFETVASASPVKQQTPINIVTIRVIPNARLALYMAHQWTAHNEDSLPRLPCFIEDDDTPEEKQYSRPGPVAGETRTKTKYKNS